MIACREKREGGKERGGGEREKRRGEGEGG